MAKLKEDGEFQVEGSVAMWLPVEAEEGERVKVNSAKEIWPEQVWLNVNQENGNWVVGTASVKGRLYRKDNTVGERWDERMYSGPHDDGEFEGPEWLIDLISREVPRRLGADRGSPLTDKQVYDLNNRLNSNLGLQPTRKVLEDVLGTSPVEVREVAKDHSYEANMSKVDGRIAELEAALQPSPQRVQFDSALRVLLMRANLDGTEWAIQQLRDSAAAAARVAEAQSEVSLDSKLILMALGIAADELEKSLDKRAAELATKGN
jgi:hypothetical protein